MNCTAVQGKTQPCRIEVLSKAVSQSPSASLKGVFSDPVEKGVEQEAHDAGHTDDGRQSNCQRQECQRDPPLAAALVVGDEAAGRSPRSAGSNPIDHLQQFVNAAPLRYPFPR